MHVLRLIATASLAIGLLLVQHARGASLNVTFLTGSRTELSESLESVTYSNGTIEQTLADIHDLFTYEHPSAKLVHLMISTSPGLDITLIFDLALTFRVTGERWHVIKRHNLPLEAKLIDHSSTPINRPFHPRDIHVPTSEALKIIHDHHCNGPFVQIWIEIPSSHRPPRMAPGESIHYFPYFDRRHLTTCILGDWSLAFWWERT